MEEISRWLEERKSSSHRVGAHNRRNMSGATAELVRLIDLSLGSQPSGAVNFNYLHALMHAIVGRLGSMEHAYLAGAAADGLILPVGEGDVAGGGAAGIVGGRGDVDGAGAPAGDGAGERTTTTVGESSGGGGGGDGSKESGPGGGESKEGAVASGASQPGKAEEGVDGADDPKKESPLPPPGAVPPSAGGDALSESRVLSSGRASRTGQYSSSDFYHRQKSSFVTAANDLGAMERKLQELESRLNAMDTLPELLERKSSDMGATPIKDRWNFTNLSKRLSAAEDGLEQVLCLCVCNVPNKMQNFGPYFYPCIDIWIQVFDFNLKPTI